MFRSKMSKSKSRRSFSKGIRTNGRNLRANPMRGGYRI